MGGDKGGYFAVVLGRTAKKNAREGRKVRDTVIH